MFSPLLETIRVHERFHSPSASSKPWATPLLSSSRCFVTELLIEKLASSQVRFRKASTTLSRIERHPLSPQSHVTSAVLSEKASSGHHRTGIVICKRLVLTAAAPAPAHGISERFPASPSPASRPPHHPTITTSLVRWRIILPRAI
ncbi:hypothetical protein L1887_52868 [Cichorium endivia]|nr:hypothetical protein L1887_52868 [Cichorium endivia]